MRRRVGLLLLLAATLAGCTGTVDKARPDPPAPRIEALTTVSLAAGAEHLRAPWPTPAPAVSDIVGTLRVSDVHIQLSTGAEPLTMHGTLTNHTNHALALVILEAGIYNLAGTEVERTAACARPATIAVGEQVGFSCHLETRDRRPIGSTVIRVAGDLFAAPG